MTDTALPKTPGQLYHAASKWQGLQGYRLIQVCELSLDQRVLDIGCGTGDLTDLLAQLVGADGFVCGFDENLTRVQLATELYKRPNLRFVHDTAQRFLRHFESDWHICTCNYVIHWIKERQPFFANVFKSLTPGGRFALSTIEALPEPFRVISELLGRSGEQVLDSLTFVPCEQLENELVANGFVIRHKSRSIEEQTFESPDKAFDFWTATASLNATGGERSVALSEFTRLAGDELPLSVQESVVRIVAQKPPNC